MSWLSDLKNAFSDAQSVWSGEKTLDQLYVEKSGDKVAGNAGDVVIGGFNVTQQVNDFIELDKSDPVAVESFFEEKKSEGWEEYTPTWFEEARDNLESAIEQMGDFVADAIERNYGVDIPMFGSDEWVENGEGSARSFNILGLVIPASIIGVLFLL